MRFRTLALVGVALVGVTCGCSGGSNLVPDGPVDVERLQESSKPYFWVGRSFEGMDLTYTEAYGDGSKRVASLIYGDCDAGGGFFSDGGCAPPLELQHRLCRGELTVVLFVGKQGLAARTARALRPLNRAARRVEPRLAIGQSQAC